MTLIERLLAAVASLATITDVLVRAAPLLLLLLHGDTSVVGAAAITEQPYIIRGTGTVRDGPTMPITVEPASSR